MEDTLLYFGDAVKVLDDSGRVGGLLVRFSDVKYKDLDGQYFDKNGYYGPKNGDGAECLFDHGYPVPAKRYFKNLDSEMLKALTELADHTFAPIKTSLTPLGIFAETVLNLEDDYEKFIFSRVKKGKIGWSSGAPGHRVKAEKDGRITRWPIAEGSLTPRPAEPMSRVVSIKSLAAVKFVTLDEDDAVLDDALSSEPSVKSFTQNILSSVLSRHIDDRVDDGHTHQSIIKSLAREAGIEAEQVEAILSDTVRASDANLKAFARVLDLSFDVLKSATRKDYAKTIKGMFEESLNEQIPSRWQLDSIYCDIIKKIANTAQASAITGVEFDSEAKIKEATAEYLARLQELAVNQVNTYVESGSDEPFYLKAIIDFNSELPATESLEPDDHCSLAASAFKSVVARFERFHQTRVKAGRVLSEKNRARLVVLVEQIKQAVSDCETLLDETKPMASDEAKRAALTNHLRLKHERRQAIGA